MLDDQGNYCITEVKYYDDASANACHSGLEWELLSWKMDEEEPVKGAKEIRTRAQSSSTNP